MSAEGRAYLEQNRDLADAVLARLAAIGERVRLWQPGDRVMGLTAGGSHAERLVTHERQVMRVPDGIDLADAAAIPEVYLTAWDALVVQGGLTSGRWALVHEIGRAHV